MKFFIEDNWTLSSAQHTEQYSCIPAKVPGCVHTDLLNAGLIDDPYYSDNEQRLQWIGETDWIYRCEFNVDSSLLQMEHVDIVFDGLDTIARVEMNGHILGTTADMFHPHRFDVKSYLRLHHNELTVYFSSPIKYAKSCEARIGTLPHVFEQPYNFIRKMACNLGWDWAPTLITSGIWKPVYLEGWHNARINSVRPLVVKADESESLIDVHVDLEWERNAVEDGEVEIEVSLYDPDKKNVCQKKINVKHLVDSVVVPLNVLSPKLWWPAGYGLQYLYDLQIRLVDRECDFFLDDRNCRFGLRDIRLNTDADSVGSKFIIEVNGKEIFCKGANWVPCDCFPSNVTKDMYRERIGQALEANMNILRVWGGGIYENDEFYDVCDENGILVWQDFALACALYSEESPYLEQIETEARYNISRLSCHPSLVIWCGGNENIWAYVAWGKPNPSWKEQAADRGWGIKYYLEMFPRLMRELDPSRPYWPSSPYSGSEEIHPQDERHGNMHIWDVWQERHDYTEYVQYRPRFLTEFGFLGYPTYATLTESIPQGEISFESVALQNLQKAPEGNSKLIELLQKHFDVPESFDDLHYLIQLNQVRALRYGIEWFRSIEPRCMGILFWQLNDCWPCVSFSAIDGKSRLKPLWYEIRKLYSEHMLTIQPDKDGSLRLVAMNDSDYDWEGEVALSRLKFDGTLCAGDTVKCKVPKRSITCVNKLSNKLAIAEEETQEMIVARFGNVRTVFYFTRDKYSDYPDVEGIVHIKPLASGYEVAVQAKKLIRDAVIYVDRLDPDARISDQMVTILPGETYTFEITSKKKLTIDALITKPVFQSANNFGVTSRKNELYIG